MKTLLTYLIPAFVLGIMGPAAPAADEEKSPPLTRQEAVLISANATVQAVDMAKRELTLKGPLGNVVTLAVDQRVKRLKEVKVGDNIQIDYYVALAAELREPTAEEKSAPLRILATRAKAPAGTDPAGGGLRVFKVVTTVEGLDRPTQSVTIKGPLGNYLTVRAKDVANLEKLRLGDTIVVTYSEALAVSLQKKKK